MKPNEVRFGILYERTKMRKWEWVWISSYYTDQEHINETRRAIVVTSNGDVMDLPFSRDAEINESMSIVMDNMGWKMFYGGTPGPCPDQSVSFENLTITNYAQKEAEDA